MGKMASASCSVKGWISIAAAEVAQQLRQGLQAATAEGRSGAAVWPSGSALHTLEDGLLKPCNMWLWSVAQLACNTCKGFGWSYLQLWWTLSSTETAARALHNSMHKTT